MKDGWWEWDDLRRVGDRAACRASYVEVPHEGEGLQCHLGIAKIPIPERRSRGS